MKIEIVVGTCRKTVVACTLFKEGYPLRPKVDKNNKYYWQKGLA